MRPLLPYFSIVCKSTMNYFEPKSVAERYAHGRPYFHPQVIRRLQAYLSLLQPMARALDVGCGTGLSSLALKEMARRIVGVDRSAPMIALAPPAPQIDYLISPAEQLPVQDNAFDLITVSSAFHWVDHRRFLAEARRVLRPRAWLIVYDNYLAAAQTPDNAAFQRWAQDYYTAAYPMPPREPVHFDADPSANEGFHLVGQENYQNLVTFSIETLLDYLVTQSNISVAVEGQNQRLEDVRQALRQSLAPCYGHRLEVTLVFGGPIWYLRKHSAGDAG